MTDVVADTAAWVAVGVSCLAVLVYGVQAWFNHKQVKASQEQVKLSQEQTQINQELLQASQNQLRISQDQLQISQEQEYAMAQPLLLPLGPEQLGSPSQDVIKVRDVGLGTALNIRGVVFGAQDDKERWPRNLWFPNPIAPREEPVTAQNMGQPELTGKEQIGLLEKYEFYAPKRNLQEIEKGLVPIIYRLVLTYHDIHGRKYASIFNRTHTSKWEFVAFIPKIREDIGDIESVTKRKVLSGEP